MSQDNNIQQKIQGTSLSDYGDSAAWQYLKWGSLAVVIIVLLDLLEILVVGKYAVQEFYLSSFNGS